MKIYLAGPMTGIKDFNFPAFHKAAKELRAMGHEVFSPAEKDEETYGVDLFKGSGDPDKIGGMDFKRVVLGIDLAWICDNAQGIALMEGWEKSTGAIAESAVANALNIPRFIQVDLGWLEIDKTGRLTGKSIPHGQHQTYQP